MKTMIAVAALGLLCATEASARTNWQGEAVVTAVNAACTAEAENVGAIYKVMFYPSGITDNGADSYMTFHGYRNVFSARIAAGRPGTGKAYSVAYVNSYGKNSAQPSGKFNTYTQSPAALATTTPFVTATMQMTNWGAIVGCTATLEAAFVRRR